MAKLLKLFYRIRSSRIRANNKMFVLIAILAVNACIAGTIPATPENITVTFLTPTTVRVSWQTMIDLNAHPIEKYIVTYKPTDDRVVQDVAGNSEAIILDRLSPSTQYSIAVTAIWLGKKYRSRQIIFRTLDMPKTSSQQDLLGVSGSTLGVNGGTNANSGSNFVSRTANGSGIYSDDVTSTATNTLSHGTHRELPTIRGVEIGIVLIVLMVWAGAIALFFNRWGKIRMLLPYQPDYKHEQLKVPGTGVCSGGVCNGQHSHQNLHPDMFVKHFHMLQEEHSASISERCTRSRINSAIFVSSEGRGFDSIEFLRRHGSQSVLCRKARSAENITDNERKKSFSDNKRQWRTDESNNDSTKNANEDEVTAFELKDCSAPAASDHASAKANVDIEQHSLLSALKGHSAAVTTSTSNVVVGSISIEAPPAYIKDEADPLQSMQQHPGMSSTHSANSASHDSTDTVEELILVPVATAATTTTTATALESRKPRVLVHQRSSNATCSPNSSPKPLTLRSVKSKIAALPVVSVSGPSPPHDKPTHQPTADGL